MSTEEADFRAAMSIPYFSYVRVFFYFGSPCMGTGVRIQPCLSHKSSGGHGNEKPSNANAKITCAVPTEVQYRKRKYGSAAHTGLIPEL